MLDVFTNWINPIVQNYGNYIGVITAAVIVFDRIAKLTPTTKDDSVLNWIYKIFAVLGLKVPDLEYNSKGQIVAS